jgi:hypothetical protein
VAVKVVTLGMVPAQRDEMIEAATHEVKLLQSLHHPNIVRVVPLVHLCVVKFHAGALIQHECMSALCTHAVHSCTHRLDAATARTTATNAYVHAGDFVWDGAEADLHGLQVNACDGVLHRLTQRLS